MRVSAANNVLAAGRAAWASFKAAEAAGLDHLLDVGRALVVGRRHALRVSGAKLPQGKPYIDAFRRWCGDNGFGDVPARWRGDLAWVAENEAEVRAYHAAQAAIRSASDPSIHPAALRRGIIRTRKNGPPKKRRAPTVAAMRIEALCDQLAARLAARDPATVIAEIAQLAAALEDAHRAAVQAPNFGRGITRK